MTKNVLNKLGFLGAVSMAAVGFPLIFASSASAQLPAPAVPANPAAPSAEVERVVVTGSNIPTAEETGPNPVDTYRPQDLEKLGIRTVINLRYFNDDEDEVKGTSLRAMRTKILTWRIDDAHVVEVMRMLQDTENGPFLIHCQHGADRTGLMTAMYRILEQKWTPEDALKELTEGGYGYHSMWKNIPRYVISVDVERLRAAILKGDSPHFPAKGDVP